MLARFANSLVVSSSSWKKGTEKVAAELKRNVKFGEREKTVCKKNNNCEKNYAQEKNIYKVKKLDFPLLSFFFKDF